MSQHLENAAADGFAVQKITGEAALHPQRLNYGERIEQALAQGEFGSALDVAREAAAVIHPEEFGVLMLKLMEGLYHSLPEAVRGPSSLEDAISMMDWNSAFRLVFNQSKLVQQGQVAHETFSASCAALMIRLTEADPQKANAFMRTHRDALGMVGCGEVFDAVFLTHNARSARSHLAAEELLLEHHEAIDDFRVAAYWQIGVQTLMHNRRNLGYEWRTGPDNRIGDAHMAILERREREIPPTLAVQAIAAAAARNNQADKQLLIAFARVVGDKQWGHRELQEVITVEEWRSKAVDDVLRQLGVPAGLNVCG